MPRSVFIFLFTLLSLFSFSQLPKDFSWPVDSTILITGNFGEIRLNHFHYGLDISIGGKEGMKILAAGDGYISRIKVGTGGYGKAIYITHPNGYTTVYGHLRAITGKAGPFVKKKQYENKKFEFEFYPDKDDFPVRKGEIIGEGGNTGYSAGPHLHFEIRQTSTEKVINPYLFGLMTSDTVPPFLNAIAIEPTGVYSDVNGINSIRRFKLVRKKGFLKLEVKDTIEIRGPVGILAEAWDLESRKNSRNGIYKMEMYVDGELRYAHQLDSFSFPESRAVNAHVDYGFYKEQNRHFERCYRTKCDPLSLYHHLKDNGLIIPGKKKVIVIRVVVYDFKNRKSEVSFPLKCSAFPGDPEVQKPLVRCDTVYSNITSAYQVHFPPGVTYNDQQFQLILQTKAIPSNCITSNLYVFVQSVPAHEAFTLSMKYPDTLKLKPSQLTMVRIDQKGNLSYAGGKAEKGWITESFRTFGTYAVSYDTVAPKIKTLTSFTKPLLRNKFIQLKVSDNLSGVSDWSLTIDGKWYLSEYEPKTGLISFLPNDLKTGTHEGKLEVWDNCGNRRELKVLFTLL